MSNNNNNRRQFLKNSSLAAFALSSPIATTKANIIDANSEEDLLTCEKTTLDLYGQGPFYTENPPNRVKVT